MERITERQLRAMVDRINTAAGTPATPYTQYANGVRANIGNYHLDSAYGGWKLVRMVNLAGGIENITEGFVSKRELYGQLQAFLNGIGAGKGQPVSSSGLR